jgi:mannose-6-phosphate isomerase-like protein (cupin superfamily)
MCYFSTHRTANYLNILRTNEKKAKVFMEKVNIAEKLKQIQEFWKPHIFGGLNGQYVKLTKLKGRFIWHYHKDEDEMFLVLKGRLLMELRERQFCIEEGELS